MRLVENSLHHCSIKVLRLFLVVLAIETTAYSHPSLATSPLGIGPFGSCGAINPKREFDVAHFSGSSGKWDWLRANRDPQVRSHT